MRWAADGHRTALAALIPLLDPLRWPCVPGFSAVTPPRPMRAVLRGALPGPAGPVQVALKWQRPHRAADHAARRLRGGKGPREGRVLAVLRAAGVAVPEVLAYASSPDVLLTRWCEGLTPLPAADDAPLATVDAEGVDVAARDRRRRARTASRDRTGAARCCAREGP